MTILKLFFKYIFTLITLLQSMAVFGQTDPSLLQKYITEFNTGKPLDKQLICEKLMWSGISDPRLYDLIEQDLIIREKTTKAKLETNNVAWLIKALGASGLSKYIKTLNNLTSHHNKKIVKYAKKGLNLIPIYAIWNPIISDTSNINTEKSEIINHYANMIRSDILELNILAGKRIFHEQINDKYLYELLSEKVLAGHKSVSKNDKMKISAYAWMMRASIKTNIATTQEVLKSSTNKKLKKYAKKYIAAIKKKN
jgi:hypothetical protein